jgi:hypothetical protein
MRYAITNTGYLPDSPDKNNDFNIIPSGNITMRGVTFPILGKDNLGNTKLMFPGQDYKFPGSHVKEIPLRKFQYAGDATRVASNANERMWGINRHLDSQNLSDDDFRQKYNTSLHNYRMRDSDYASSFQRQMEQRRMSDPNYAELNLPQTDVRSKIYQGNPNLAFIPGTSKGESRAAIEDVFLATTTATAPLLPVNTAKIAKGAQQLGKYLTEETALRNAYKLNPYAFKPQEGMMYRGIGKEGMEDALQSGVFRPKNAANTKKEFVTESGEVFNFGKSFDKTYYSPDFEIADRYGKGYIGEVPNTSAVFNRRYANKNWSYHTNRQIPIQEGKLLQKDWLKGYKPIEVPKPTFSSINDVVTSGVDGNFLTRPLTPFTKNELSEGRHLYRKIGNEKGLQDLINNQGAKAPKPILMKSGEYVDAPFFGIGDKPNENYSGLFAVETKIPSQSKYDWSNRVGGVNNYGVAPYDKNTGELIDKIPLEDLEVYRKKFLSNSYRKLDKNNLQEEMKYANLQNNIEKTFKWGVRGTIADRLFNNGDFTNAISDKVDSFLDIDKKQTGGEKPSAQKGVNFPYVNSDYQKQFQNYTPSKITSKKVNQTVDETWENWEELYDNKERNKNLFDFYFERIQPLQNKLEPNANHYFSNFPASKLVSRQFMHYMEPTDQIKIDKRKIPPMTSTLKEIRDKALNLSDQELEKLLKAKSIPEAMLAKPKSVSISDLNRYKKHIDSLMNVGYTFQNGGEMNKYQYAGEWFDKIKSNLNPYNWGVDDYTNKGNFNSAYSSARKAGDKEFMWNNKRYSTDYKGTPEQQLRETGITNDQTRNKNIIDDRFYKNLNPFGYEDDLTNTFKRMYKTIVKDEKDPSFAENFVYSEKDIQNRMDAFRLYTGRPQENNTFKISPYKPSISKDKNTNYYSINDPRLREQLLEEVLQKSLQQGKSFALTDEILLKYFTQDQMNVLKQNDPVKTQKLLDEVIKPKIKNDHVAHLIYDVDMSYKDLQFDHADPSNIMANFKRSFGKDEKGSYMSYYDRWDIAPFQRFIGNDFTVDKNFKPMYNGRFQSDMNMDVLGKPFEIYDRIYYDPKTGKPLEQKQKGGEMKKRDIKTKGTNLDHGVLNQYQYAGEWTPGMWYEPGPGDNFNTDFTPQPLKLDNPFYQNQPMIDKSRIMNVEDLMTNPGIMPRPLAKDDPFLYKGRDLLHRPEPAMDIQIPETVPGVQDNRPQTTFDPGWGMRKAMLATLGLNAAVSLTDKKPSEYDYMMRQQGNSFNQVRPRNSNADFGNYTLNAGLGSNFRPRFEEGGEYDLSQEEIEELIRQGYDIEFL